MRPLVGGPGSVEDIASASPRTACGRPWEAVSDGICRVGVAPQVVEVGLSSDQAARLLAECGPNRFPAHRPSPWRRRLAAEMVHFFALLSGLRAVWLSSPGCLSWA